MNVLRWLAVTVGVLTACAVLALGILFHLFDKPGPLSGPAIAVVPQGAGLARIATLLERNGILRDALVFRLGVRLAGKGGALKAGEYEFPGRASARDVMEVLESGDTYVRRLTVPEGLTSAQVLDRVTAAYGLDGLVGPIPDEGALLPDTYHYSYGDTREGLIERMKAAMTETVTRLWRARDPSVPLDGPPDAVTLASIVERETGVASERAVVAGVFYNRLRRNMPLQSDPTVAYGVAVEQGIAGRVLDRPLTRKDLETDTPYNTYLYRGLPPGPIANPGRAALDAVLHPAATDALYFVADGNGGHVFSETLDGHNRNVREWRRLQRQQREDAARERNGAGPDAAPQESERPDAAEPASEAPDTP